MIYILTNGSRVINVDNDVARLKLLDRGYWTLTDKEIADAGMLGFERFVGPQNTKIENGVIHFTPPPPKKMPIPKSISPRQARLALLGAGLLDTVEQAIAAMAGPEGQAAKIMWEYATEVRRNDPLLVQLTGALGMTDARLDEMFVQGSKL